LEGQTKFFVEDSEIAISAADNCRWPDCLHLLGQDANIGRVAAIVGEAIEAKTVGEMA